ncbi:hypothetical protein CYMTET_33919, partial [Cymbomonas tetramitiformis]
MAGTGGRCTETQRGESEGGGRALGGEARDVGRQQPMACYIVLKPGSEESRFLLRAQRGDIMMAAWLNEGRGIWLSPAKQTMRIRPNPIFSVSKTVTKRSMRRERTVKNTTMDANCEEEVDEKKGKGFQVIMRQISHLTQFYTANEKGEEDVMKEGDDVEVAKQIPAGIMTVNGGFVVRYGIFFDNLRGDPLPFEEGVRRCIPYEDARMMSKGNSGRASSMWSWTPLSEVDGSIPESEAPAQPRLWRLYYNLWNWGIMLFVALEFMEDKPHLDVDETLRSDVFDLWVREFEELKTKQSLKNAATRGTGGRSAKDILRRKDRDGKGEGKGLGRKGAGSSRSERSFADDSGAGSSTPASGIANVARANPPGTPEVALWSMARGGRQRPGLNLESARGSEHADGYHMVNIRRDFQKFMQVMQFIARGMAALQAADLGYDAPVKGRCGAPSKGAVAVHMTKGMAALQAADLGYDSPVKGRCG